MHKIVYGSKVRIPTPLRKLTNNEELVEINATTLGDAITELQSRYPGIRSASSMIRVQSRRFVNVYVNEEDIGSCKTSRRVSKTATRSASSQPSPGG